jgi:alkylglycerol monooxygenase
MDRLPHLGLLAFCVLAPVAIVLLASTEFRTRLRGTGSIRQTLSNAGVGVVFLTVQLLLRGALIAAYAGVASLVPYRLPSGAWWAPPLAFVLLDFVYYVQHRLEHAVPLLWAIHSVHHQSRDFNLSVSVRAGALSSLSTLGFHCLLALCGVGANLYTIVVTIHLALVFTLHARTKFTLGPGRFFNAPVLHRVHHGSESRHIDKNFGGVFMIFDRLFATFSPYVVEPTFGVTGEPNRLNPVEANVAPIGELVRVVAAQPRFIGKMKALFVRPGCYRD